MNGDVRTLFQDLHENRSIGRVRESACGMGHYLRIGMMEQSEPGVPALAGSRDHFDADRLLAYPPGSVIVLPGDTYHFHWAKSSEYITQVTAIGPLGLEYSSAKDDPRQSES